jgi:osmotically-inducible protein OsmY
VKVSGSKITLSGSVKTPYQKDEASRIAWNAPGVSNVVNDLVLDNNYC